MAVGSIGVVGHAIPMFIMTPPLFQSKGDLINDSTWQFFSPSTCRRWANRSLLLVGYNSRLNSEIRGFPCIEN